MIERGAEALNEMAMEHYRAHRQLQDVGTSPEVPATEHRAAWDARILREVLDAITGPRNRDYGDPWVNHGKTAEVWRWWIKSRFGVDIELTDLDVCMFNILQKQSRLTNSIEHEDSWRDVAGFAGNAGVCMDHANGKIPE